MRDSQIQTMNTRELMILKKRIDDEIASRRVNERDALIKKIEAMAKRAGFQVKDLFGHGRDATQKRRSGCEISPPEKTRFDMDRPRKKAYLAD